MAVRSVGGVDVLVGMPFPMPGFVFHWIGPSNLNTAGMHSFVATQVQNTILLHFDRSCYQANVFKVALWLMYANSAFVMQSRAAGGISLQNMTVQQRTKQNQLKRLDEAL